MKTIVIGAGVAGCVVARKLAEEGKREVLVLEKRNHIGGNCYDRQDEHGILIHVYGPHIFHTNMEEVFAYFDRFTDWTFFEHKVVARVGDKQIPIPFNLNTLHMVYEKETANVLEQKLVATYGEGSRVPIMKLLENPDEDIRQIARYVYENVFLHYTMKQWGQTPEEISPEVTGRVPVLISYDNRYFQDKYQGVPAEGFTALFEKMLDHPCIQVETGVEALDRLKFTESGIYFDGQQFTGKVIYTGALDELFEYKYGKLPYRSLRFDIEHMDTDDFQGHAVVNYTVSEDFTRITEFKHLTKQSDTKGTTIVREYPFAYTGAEGEIPYYAILNDENEALYKKYQEAASEYENLYCLGRLAEYKYYNIDVMAKKAMDLADDIMGKKESV